MAISLLLLPKTARIHTEIVWLLYAHLVPIPVEKFWLPAAKIILPLALGERMCAYSTHISK